MDLELATAEDIANELNRRGLRFFLIAMENTNTSRDDQLCIAGRAEDHEDLVELVGIGQIAIEMIGPDDEYPPGDYEL